MRLLFLPPLLHTQNLAVLFDPYFSPVALDLLILLPWTPSPGASLLTGPVAIALGRNKAAPRIDNMGFGSSNRLTAALPGISSGDLASDLTSLSPSLCS